jgi:hypothetical protein
MEFHHKPVSEVDIAFDKQECNLELSTFVGLEKIFVRASIKNINEQGRQPLSVS